MTKKKVVLFLVCLFMFLSACAYNNTSQNLNELPLQKFIIGKWYGEIQTTDIHGSYVKEFYVEFINEHRLNIQMLSPYDELDVDFSYEFTDNQTILVENERTENGTWEINKIDTNLHICIWSDENCAIFTRFE